MANEWTPVDLAGAFSAPRRAAGDPAATARGREETPAQVRSRATERLTRLNLAGRNHADPTPVMLVLSEAQRDLCFHHAEKAETGGRSNIHKGNTEERMARIKVDQQIGQLGTLAMLIWQLGPERGEAEYVAGRLAIELDPKKGDGGSDITGGNEDAKATLRRRPDKPLYDYNLVVRPREQHEGTVYVQCLVEPDMRTVNLLGWATCEELLARNYREPERFGDAAVFPARELHPLPPFRWAA